MRECSARARVEAAKAPMRVVHIHIGEHFVTDDSDIEISTVLGSCVGACIRDPLRGVGGMNHFMLPGHAGPTDPSTANELRYGQVAMERLINDLLKAGASRRRLEIKIFGGANTLATGLRIGDGNVAFVRHFLAVEGMEVAAEDLGGKDGRRVRYHPVSGRVLRLNLESARERRLFRREQDFSGRLDSTDVDGSVELFD